MLTVQQKGNGPPMNQLKLTKQTGFTIVELLIVIVVIGILAAITIVAYNGIQNRAYNTTVQSDLSNFAKKMGIYQAETGAYPVGLSSSMDITFSRSAYNTSMNNIYYCADATGTNYSLTAMSKSQKAFTIGSQNGLREYSGGWSGVNACTGTGFTTSDSRSHGYNTATTPNWQPWVTGP